MKRVGIIAGFGDYPILLAKYLKQSGCQVFCLGIRDQVNPEIQKYCESFHQMGLGQFGKAVRFFLRNEVTEATMAGGIAKRQLYQKWLVWHFWPDWYTVRLFAPHFIFRTKDNTSDSLLLTCAGAFERCGIKLLPGTDLAPELLVKREKLTKKTPTQAQWKDIQFGWKVAKEMGRLDVGQTVTVKDQTIIAVEALEGTDECILRSGRMCKDITVIKVAKPKQDMRFDLPCFGMQTMKTLVEAGAKILVVEADRSIFINKQELVDYADQHGVAIIGILDDDLEKNEYDVK